MFSTDLAEELLPWLNMYSGNILLVVTDNVVTAAYWIVHEEVNERILDMPEPEIKVYYLNRDNQQIMDEYFLTMNALDQIEKEGWEVIDIYPLNNNVDSRGAERGI